MKARPKEMLKAVVLADEKHILLVTKMANQKGGKLVLQMVRT